MQTFGIYRPPRQAFPLASQELGLSLLEMSSLADFEIVCSDGVRLPCGKRMLEQRWPWFRKQMEAYPEQLMAALEGEGSGENASPTTADAKQYFSDLVSKFTPSRLLLSENSVVGRALLQYLYTLNLITPQQHDPKVLSALLYFSLTHELHHLRGLVTHAMHCTLTSGTSNAAAIYEAATLGSCLALQTRALKVMMSVSWNMRVKKCADLCVHSKRAAARRRSFGLPRLTCRSGRNGSNR